MYHYFPTRNLSDHAFLRIIKKCWNQFSLPKMDKQGYLMGHLAECDAYWDGNVIKLLKQQILLLAAETAGCSSCVHLNFYLPRNKVWLGNYSTCICLHPPVHLSVHPSVHWHFLLEHNSKSTAWISKTHPSGALRCAFLSNFTLVYLWFQDNMMK